MTNPPEPQPNKPLSHGAKAKLAELIANNPPLTWPEIEAEIIPTLIEAMTLNKHGMGGVWGERYEAHVARFAMTLTIFRQMHEDPKFWWRVRARFVARVKTDPDLTHDTMDAIVSDAPETHRLVNPFTINGPLWHMVHAVFETINMDLEMPGYEHFERMPETAYPSNDTIIQKKEQRRLILEENPTGGETVTLGDKTFTFVTKIEADDQILIGADMEETIRNARNVDETFRVMVAEKWPTGAALSAAMLAKALYETSTTRSSDQPEKFDDLHEERQRWHAQSAGVILRHLAAQRPEAIHYAKPDYQAQADAMDAVREYAQRVAEVFDIEGGQIKPNDPRLGEPDNRCSTCVATMNEPQPLTPVRRQVHERLQTGWHFDECPHRTSLLDELIDEELDE